MATLVTVLAVSALWDAVWPPRFLYAYIVPKIVQVRGSYSRVVFPMPLQKIAYSELDPETHEGWYQRLEAALACPVFFKCLLSIFYL